ncbi:MAG TPA: LPS export ABC transporter periplasmic protein LptC [Bacteroidales bacterium]|nr:MAG: LPS export ABC transporter periplasmic protein LptC [Bacteroidetes bacterium GWE2_42_42]HCB61430.1 LPS export ABC transporter periplasmic protein LptC [Bacteroidales bacterium]HCY23335.1 LPS export ABC transporter periplasmic protein LptC [Bacteroidales bacterium]
MVRNYKSLKIIIVAAFAVTMIFSCGNSMNSIQEVAVKDTLPVEQALDVTMYYSDSGHIEACLTAPVTKRYESKDQKGILKLTDGLKVIFYDSLGREETVLTARYGERFDELQRIEVKYDVVIITADSEKMYTDHLIWDEKANRVYSNVFIKIITPDKIIWGDGFESDESFDQYRILRPKGEIEIKDDKNASE